MLRFDVELTHCKCHFQIKELTNAKNRETHQKQQIQSELNKIKTELNSLKTNEKQLSRVRILFSSIANINYRYFESLLMFN